MRDDPRVRSRWREGPVDAGREHIRLCFGDDREPIALVAPVGEREFNVEFLIDQEGDPSAAEALVAVRRELDFYLVEKNESHPWEYAVHHCATASNLYSSVHWEHNLPGGSGPVG